MHGDHSMARLDEEIEYMSYRHGSDRIWWYVPHVPLESTGGSSPDEGKPDRLSEEVQLATGNAGPDLDRCLLHLHKQFCTHVVV